MNIALAMEDDYRAFQNLDLEPEPRLESTIRHLCGLFINVIDQRIYLIHQTGKDFLFAEGEVSSDRWKYSLNPLDSELLLAKICVLLHQVY